MHPIGLAVAAGALSLLASSGFAAGCESIEDGKCRISLPTGVELAYVEAGSTDGPTVILLHGLTDSLRSWAGAMQAMRESWPDLRVIAIDQRGHGDSSLPDPEACRAMPEDCFGMADFAADLLAFMDARQIRRAILAGESMGSFVAQEVALSAPERVERLVLVASAARGRDNAVLRDYVLKEPVEGSWRQALAALGRAFPDDVYELTPRDADPNIETWLAQFWDVDPVADPALVAAIVEDTADVPIGTWIGATRGLLAVDNRERLRELQVPTLTLWGRQDAIFHDDPDQRELRDALAAAHARHGTRWAFKAYGALPLPASGVQESDLGHNLQWEAPAAVAGDILSFMKTGRPTGDLIRSRSAAHPRELVTEAGKADIVGAP